MTAGNQPSSSGGVDALLPCPFCGGEATYDTDWEMEGGPGERIVCLVCDAQTVWLEMGNKEASIKAWNARAPRPVALAQPSPDQRLTEDMTLAHNARKAAIEECARVATRAARRCVRERLPGDSVAAYIEREILALYAVTPSPGARAWTPDQFWEYVGAMAGEFEAGQMRDMMAAKGLAITSTDQQCPECEANGLCARHAVTSTKFETGGQR